MPPLGSRAAQARFARTPPQTAHPRSTGSARAPRQQSRSWSSLAGLCDAQFCGLRPHGQPHDERAPDAVLIISSRDFSTVCPHDPVADAEAKSCALSNFLRREEWIENPFGLRNPRPIVADQNLELVCSLYRQHFDSSRPPRLLNRVIGVIQDIEEHLLQLVRVSHKHWQVLFISLDELDAVIRKIIRAKLQRLPQHVVPLHGFTLRRHLPGKAKKVLNDDPSALRLLKNHAKLLFCRFGNLRILEQQVGETYDSCQRIVHLMRHTGNELAQGRHFFRMHQFRLQICGISHVRHHYNDAIDVALLIPHWTQADRKLSGSSIPAYHWHLEIVDRGPLQRPLKRLLEHRPSRGGNNVGERMPQQIRLLISRTKTAAVRS